ncbi:MAG: Flp family type IVb pilin [Rhodospirillales bacterium]|nr:Flp family type IVb pilin [Rhodospirillales bacterium]
MMRIRALARRLAQDETAATAVEYALLVAFVATVVATSVRTIGTNLQKGIEPILPALK